MFLCASLLLLGSASATAQELPYQEVPEAKGPLKPLPPNVIFVKGAEPSSSDRLTPLPEDAGVVKNVFQDRYFGISWTLPQNWTEDVEGPPPSETAGYVLSQLIPTAGYKGRHKGTVLISAQDMFFSPHPVENAMELIRSSKENLPEYYEAKQAPKEVRIGDRTFARFDYWSPVAGLHWFVLATEIRCHTVQFVFTSQDTEMLESLIQSMNAIQFPAATGIGAGKGGGDVPLCIADYARKENIIYKVEPQLNDRRFNSIPVRIVIGKTGKVKHIHIISAFADQATKISDALYQWRFKPYKQNGEPVEVETGIVFGSPGPQRTPVTPAKGVSTTSLD